MDATIAKPVEAAAAALRAGEPLLLYDAPGREGETDIVFAARHATPERVRLLRQRGGGLVFIAVAHDAAERLGLPFMDAVLDSAAADFPALSALRAHDLPYDSRSSFSLWLNARDTYTGITDRDRARTVAAFGELAAAGLEPDAAQLLLGERFRSPGHVPVCVAHPDGLAGRQGHTELMVALAEMAGLPPVTFGCEMLADDGGRLPPEAAAAWAEAGGHPFLEGHEIVAAWDTSA
ncbi:MAG: 3,4-dihydroxy-2-butanone-4-phosphate synthase [Candidatus Poseidoniia archaeon]|nr:3,4-dihydroxy-2-butanone-4-phosphate synthase [Candidatus Poseidoniia archaeon]